MIPIVLLLGSSSVGKTSICNDRAFNNFEKIGVDLAFKDRNILQPAIKIAIEEILDKFSNSSIAKIIKDNIGENVCENINKIEELKDSLEKIVKKMTDLILANKKTSLQNPVYKSFIEVLYNNKIIHASFCNALDKGLFVKAISNASIGKSTIIDVIPNSYYNTMDLFKKVLAKYNYTGITVILHCSLRALNFRVDHRNFLAKQNNNKNELREGFFPFKQYANLFGVLNESKELIVDSVIVKDIKNLFSIKFQEDNVNLLIKALLFKNLKELDNDFVLKIRSRNSNYNLIIDTSVKTSKFAANVIFEHVVSKFFKKLVINILNEEKIVLKIHRLLEYTFKKQQSVNKNSFFKKNPIWKNEQGVKIYSMFCFFPFEFKPKEFIAIENGLDKHNYKYNTVLEKLVLKDFFGINLQNDLALVTGIKFAQSKSILLTGVYFNDDLKQKNMIENYYKVFLVLCSYGIMEACDFAFIAELDVAIEEDRQLVDMCKQSNSCIIKELSDNYFQIYINLANMKKFLAPKCKDKKISFKIFQGYEHVEEYKQKSLGTIFDLNENIAPPIEGYVLVNKDNVVKGGVLFSITPQRLIEVDILWIDKTLRGQKLSKILMELVDKAAKKYNVKEVRLETTSFQAPWLYPKFGFKETTTFSYGKYNVDQNNEKILVHFFSKKTSNQKKLAKMFNSANNLTQDKNFKNPVFK